MAMQLVRLRRALTSLSTLNRSLHSPIMATSASTLHQSSISPSPASIIFQSRSFIGSRISLSPEGKQYRVYKEGDEITEDMVLFEGCDFNHWLITVDFPKDPAPTPEEMVATYERICAQGLNISIEEAKKKIYACSTTTYQGFQAVMTEEESEKFKDIPGVVFVLPDSYIDPANKQYGGDKYENGVITPRPPPYQYKRGGRFNDRNRNAGPRYERQGGNPQYNQQGYAQGVGNQQYNQQGYPQGGGNPHYSQQGYPQGGENPQYSQQGYPQGGGNPQYNQQGYPQGGGNYENQPNYPPRQNYGPPGQGERMNNDNYQTNRGPFQGQQGGPYQGNYNQGQPESPYPQDQRGFPQGERRDFRGDNRNFSPGLGGPQGQGPNAGHGQGQGYPGEGQRFSQMEQRNMNGEQPPYPPMGQTGTNQGRS